MPEKDVSPDPDVSATTAARKKRAVVERDRARSQILDAARDIIRDNGVFSLSVVAVAEATGLTRTSVYRYFDGPPAMVEALAEETVGRIYARIADLDVAGSRSLDGYGRATVEEYCNDSEVNRQTVLLAGAQRFSDELVDPEVIVLENLRARQAQGLVEFDDVELAARVIVTYFRGALYGWASGLYTDEEFAVEVARSTDVGFALCGGKETL
ncbi:MAG: TetR/AcrR family transcriptional regulator [Acidimicrobiales bacterium]|jgi:AcrR family transcriptional regulator|nr:hypothetical protein [Acidimicrobiaceae bacterium]MDP6493787.1 TetR/AcrR family transcriptional regulator [Acidimicrobiales bacterium]MDP6649198.1 TetR/AcrR family transcriptional regulator [Acidimicrobiales bacterium]MDP6759221.1 TetR/AcrR family transcriptional regulator [Acidimicrobiales bacterium]|tara:strand:+ start:52 stop:687 length:636 start_codon:yes stop_codon:yes gene_type:complete